MAPASPFFHPKGTVIYNNLVDYVRGLYERYGYGEVLTPQAFDAMIDLATAFTEGVEASIEEFDLPWSIAQLGARAEYRFAYPAPRTGEEAAAAADDDLDAYMHLAMCNRGILMTPFHNMALMCPATERADVDRHTEAFHEAVAALRG